MQSIASHILGAEITYTHVKDYKYKAFVTVYRDCNECKIAGGGGGTNTKDCGQFYLYLNTSTRNGCSSKSLAQFNLTRESIQEILPLCATAVSKCQSDSGLNYGVEAHTFSTVIDFENYKAYDNCGFDMYVQIASRTDDIDNLAQSSLGERLYNYSFINPFENHSSPRFSQNPEILLTVNQAARSYVVSNATSDSVVIHFAKPLRGANNEIDYQPGYFLNRPLTVWCNGDNINCEANQNANPPVGVTLDPTTGYLAFTPIKNNEKATLVIEVELWQNTKSGMILVSVVRRDILVEVTSIGQNNNPPQLFGTSINNATNEIDACVGTELCFDIQAKDAPFLYPDGSYQATNTVSYNWTSQLSGASIKQVAISQAPYKKLQVCWTPRSQDIGKRFVLEVKASDDHCPVNASSAAQYTLTVNGLPQNRTNIPDIWCGSLMIVADSQKQNEYTTQWELLDKQGKTVFGTNKAVDTVQFDNAFNGVLSATLTSQVGCVREVITPILRTKADLTEAFGEVLGKTTYCAGDSIRLNLKQSNGVRINNVFWTRNQDTVSRNGSLRLLAKYQEIRDSIHTLLQGSKGILHCNNVISRVIKVDKGLDVVFTTIAPVCEATTNINLGDVPNIKGGVWKGINHNILAGSILDISKLGDINETVQVCQEYITTSIESACISRDTLCAWVVPNPTFDLSKTTICGASGYFNLINMDPQLFSFGSYDIEWTIDGKPLSDNPQGNKHLLELTGLTLGDHEVIGVFEDEFFGCITRDTGVLSILSDIDLEYVTDQQRCQGDQSNLSEIFDINLGGGFWSPLNNSTGVENNAILPTACGSIDLLYTYDQFGCYATKEVNLEVVCRPEITFDIHDTICAIENTFNLKAVPSIGWFEGDEVTGSVLNLGSDDKTYNFNYRVEKDICIFMYPLEITVVPGPEFAIGNGIVTQICEDQTINLSPINVINGGVRIFSIQGDTTFYGKDNVYIYTPSKNEIGQRQTLLDMKLVGKGYCPTTTKSYKVRINPKAKIHLLDSNFIGCTPYVFKPRYIYDSEVVDWSLTQTEWDLGESQKRHVKIQPITTYKTQGTYSISLHTVSPAGCVYNKTWLNAVEVHASPDASFRPYPSGEVSVVNSLIKFRNTSFSSDSMYHSWDFGTGNPLDKSTNESPSFDFGQDTGKYLVSLTTTTANNCEDVYTDNIRVLPDIQIFVPNAFSPNGKGSEVTEEFKVVGRNVTSYHIEIFNRWGEQLYQSNDINKEWNGKANGRYCEVGIYAYLIQATSTSGKTYELKGIINIVR
ncbi:MAG: gliding motility-associated-like protein [Bacteroidia bacterium]|jgi:gliding motility-associated-like protein